MRILFVALSNSITTARWMDLLHGRDWDVHLFPSERQMHPHPELHDVTLHDSGLWRPEALGESVRVAGLWPFSRGAYQVDRLRRLAGYERADRSRRLAATVRRLRPDVVHSLEMQRAGYLTLAARRRLRGAFPAWIYSAWGSDIYHFGRQPEHAPRIRGVLAACDYLMADCRRDIALARDFGFRGTALGVFPGGGGMDTEASRRHAAPGPTSARRVIAVKGYQNDQWGGRGLVALQAIHRCADVLTHYEIIVYSAVPATAVVVDHIRAVSGLRISCLPHTTHNAMLGLMGRARVALAVGTTDGTPNAMLEAMVMGALPVQSDTVSTGEWIADGRNGFLVPPEDPIAIEAALRRALEDDALVNRAAEENLAIVRERVERRTVREQATAAYERVVAEGEA